MLRLLFPDVPWYSGQHFLKDEEGILYFKGPNFQPRLCIPRSMRNEILRSYHESPFETAHAGFSKLWNRLTKLFYWPRMKTDIRRYCETCDVCQKVKPANFKRFGLLQPHHIPSRPYESISMDLITGLPMSDSHNAIWVAVDRLTKHANFVPTNTELDTEGFAELFVKHVACKFGLPYSIVTDRDPRWTHQFWKGVVAHLKTEMWLSSSHHPQHDGQTEVTNKTLETMICAYAATERASWATWLPLCEHAYNSNPAGSTGESPFFLLYGFHPRDSITGLTEGAVERGGRSVKSFLQEIEVHREAARDAIAKSQDQQAAAHNKGRKALDLKAGDLVMINPHSLEWLESKGEGAKIGQKYIGPFKVAERVGPNTYRLAMSDRYPGSTVFNIEHLKAYRSSPAEFGPRSVLPETRLHRPASEEFEVEKIVGHKSDRKTGAMMFLVRWAGYLPLYDSWVSARDLRNAPQRLHDYREAQGI